MLSPRLKAVADLVPALRCVADIGSDHALLPLYLIEKGIAQRAIAVEKARGPAATARRAVAAAGMEERIEVRVGEGLSSLSAGEAEVVVIAGMGGETIAAILTAGATVARTARLVITQPMNRAAFFRHWLTQNGWRICAEGLAKERKHLYQVIAIVSGIGQELSWLEEELGPCLLTSRHPFLKELAARTLRYYEQRLTGLSRASGRVCLRAGDLAELRWRCQELRAYLKEER